ncbi:MAG: glycine cleavage system protein H [Acidimicrobiales bacterium]
MEPAAPVLVAGFPLALDRRYHAETHMWVLATEPGRVRIGMDAVGIETSGTLAQLSFVPVGSELAAGQPFGQLEAAKFVGPLVSPVSGVVAEVNDEVVADAGLAARDPYGAGWLIEASLGDAAAELPGLLADPAEITAWFAAKVARYRLEGVIAQ